MIEARGLPRSKRRQMAAYMRRENARWPRHLALVNRDEWPDSVMALPSKPYIVWRSSRFLVMVFEEKGIVCRLSIVRTTLTSAGDWEQGIEWDDLQQLKEDAGYGNLWAVECYPPDADVVNVANMRHLWILPEPPEYGWRSKA